MNTSGFGSVWPPPLDEREGGCHEEGDQIILAKVQGKVEESDHPSFIIIFYFILL